ncbi:MAG: MFS transporter [Gammaproteobacteria bacterium]|jgi:MFS family permease|nr:MFS transporter [Gammaproteobacteria bacterium]MDP6616112.1 MFS transporter [Gammaproteobacteria bacterium]MDP6694870.1 MFS transporter [Gammaproteobacteria bacterium]
MSEQSNKLGHVRLADGVRPSHAAYFLFTAFLGISLTTFLSTIQPNLLAVNLGLPAEQQGQVSGLALFAGECVLLLSSSFIGAYSDRIGRRGVFVGGMFVLALGWVLMAYVDSVVTLVAVRVFMSFGIAVVNVMISALMVDYPAEASRGQLVALAGVMIGIGNIMIGLVYLKLPEVFAVRFGVTELTAIRYTLFTMAALSIVMALVVQIGIKGGRPSKAPEHEALIARVKVGISAGRENARILLAYFCAFVARGDLVVIGTFFTLWLTQAGIRSGMQPSEAAATTGGLFAMVMTSALLWAPIAGWLNDRMDRVKAMALAMFLAAVGYTGCAFIPDPLGPWMYPAGVLLGIGQISAVTASQTLIGQEAPPAYRGSVVGMFSMFGAAGILFISSIGGLLFDRIAPVAPFVLIGIANGILCIAALRVAKTTVPATAND